MHIHKLKFCRFKKKTKYANNEDLICKKIIKFNDILQIVHE